MSIENQILDEIKKMLKDLNFIDDDSTINYDVSLEEQFEINSINFIKLLVMLEIAFDFEFKDDDLVLGYLKSINDIVKTVISNMQAS